MTPVLRLTALLLVPLVLALATGAVAHTDVADHGHLYVSLGDTARTADMEPDDQVTYRYEGSLPVVMDRSGQPTVRFPLPDEGTLQRFTAPDLENDTDLEMRDEGGIRYAVRTWTENGPEEGAAIHNVTLQAARTVDPRGTFVIRWTDLVGIEELAVRVDVPRDHIVASGSDLVRESHGSGDRIAWGQHDFDSRTLEFSVRPASTGPSPVYSAPPHPLGGWFLLVGIAVVSGGAWAIGKKLETREGS